MQAVTSLNECVSLEHRLLQRAEQLSNACPSLSVSLVVDL